MFGKLIKPRNNLLILLFATILFAATNIGANGPQPKIEMVSEFWLFEKNEFYTSLKLDQKEILKLEQMHKDEQEERTKNSIELLLAVNCVNYPENNKFRALNSYLCEQGSFELLSSEAVSSLEGMSQFLFVKFEDIDRSIGFINRYIDFWDSEISVYNSGITLGTDSQEYLREIVDFLQYKKNEQ